MKRGIVMEVKRNKAIILCKNGRFETVRIPKGKTPGVGDTITLAGQASTGNVWTKRGLPAVSTAAVIFIFIVLLGGFGPSRPDSTIAAYVSYDVNPSFTAGVNGKMQVVSVKPWNKDAEQLFAHWQSYQYMNLKDFTHQVVQKIARKGYFADQSPSILIASSVVLQNQAKQQSKLSHSLSHSISKIRTDTIFKNQKIKVYVKNGDAQTRQKANADGLSMGKYLLYLDEKNKGKQLSVDTVQNMSVSQIEQDLHSASVSDSRGKQKIHKHSTKVTKDNNHSSIHQKGYSSTHSSGNDNQKGQTASNPSKKVNGKKPDRTDNKSNKESQPSHSQQKKNQTHNQKPAEHQQNKDHTQQSKHSHHMKRPVSIGTSHEADKNKRKHNKNTPSSEKPSSQEQNSHTRNNHSLKRPDLNIHVNLNVEKMKLSGIWLPIMNHFDRKTESQH